MTILLLLGIGVLAATAAQNESPPRIEDLLRVGRQTLEKLRESAASWRVRYRMPNGFIMETKVVRDKNRQSWSFFQVENGRAELISRIVEKEGIWHVMDAQRQAKYRPYEAELHLPGGYLLLSAADPTCVSDARPFASAKFDGRREKVASYYLPVDPAARRLMEKSVATIEQLQKEDPTRPLKPELIRTLELLKEQLAKGIPLSVDEATGILVERKLRDLLVSIQDFRWLNETSDVDFALPKTANWDDQTRPWSGNELDDCIMVGHDPLFQAGGKSPALDAYLLNIRSGRLRRLPYGGVLSMAGCFLKERREVVVSGYIPDGLVGLVRLNLETRANVLLDSDVGEGRISLAAELAPDGKKLATIQMSASGQISDLQIRIVNIEDGTSRLLGQPNNIGAPFSWLPNGEGLILKRFERGKDLNTIEPRILCRMDLDGKLTDLRRGDWPVVLYKTRKILYQEDQSKLWHTCELDGTKPQLFADGLERHGTPAVSPDETKIVFVRYEKGKLPQLLLFEVGKAQGKPIVKANGFTGTPIWR